MRPFFVAALDGVVRNEPRVAAAPEIVRGRAPPRDVRLVLVSHANRLAAERRIAARREMEDELVAVVEEALAVDWLVMADGEVALEPGARPGERLLDRNGLDPVNRVLQLEMRTRGLRDVQRRPRVGRLAADVQEERPLAGQRSRRELYPVARPFQVARARHRVVVGAIPDAQVVGRRGDDGVDRAFGEPREEIERVAEIEAEGRAVQFEGGVRRREASHHTRLYRGESI